MGLREVYRNRFDEPWRERGLLSAAGFTGTFALARAVTHAIKNGVGPFGNMSAGGTHIHHPTFGILGLLGVGYLWTYRWGVGERTDHGWESRTTATLYGACAALTLDEFALWLDLEDDYWSKEGRKSIDAVAIFAGLLSMGALSRDALSELGLLPKALARKA